MYWYKLAARLGCTVYELSERVSSTEFVGWLYFMALEREQEFERVDKLDFYLAQIATEMRQNYTDPRKKVWRVNELLIKFQKPDSESQVKVNGELEKNLWIGAIQGTYQSMVKDKQNNGRIAKS